MSLWPSMHQPLSFNMGVSTEPGHTGFVLTLLPPGSSNHRPADCPEGLPRGGWAGRRRSLRIRGHRACCRSSNCSPMVSESLPQRNPHSVVFHTQKPPASARYSRNPGALPTYYLCSVTKNDDFGLSGPILVSACLAGRACRFDGRANPDDTVGRLVAEGRAVLVCPEEDGGLGTPRPAAEIQGGDGADVLEGRARVVTKGGMDVTEAYLQGARVALERARDAGASRAVLKASSPSCGRGRIYDGTFSRNPMEGDGVTAALLIQEGIEVLTEEEL